MIRIIRGPEPEAARKARQWRLARAYIAWVEAGRPERPTEAQRTRLKLTGYDKGRSEIGRQQHHKCAYCEAINLRETEDLDHHRPRAHYWWLTWSWDNLLQACSCNQVLKDGYDLLSGHRLEPMQVPPGDEEPELVDPAREDPRDHIVFKWQQTEERWEPSARADSPRGQKTIERLKFLDSRVPARDTDMLELWATHNNSVVYNQLELVREGLETGADTIERLWAHAQKMLLHPDQPYRSLSFDILTKFRADHPQLSSVRPLEPIAAASPPLTPLFTPDPQLDELPLLLACHIRVARSRGGTQAATAVIAMIKHLGGTCTEDRLTEIFCRKKGTIKSWLREKLQDHQILYTKHQDAPAQYRLTQISQP